MIMILALIEQAQHGFKDEWKLPVLFIGKLTMYSN